ncbi:Hypothetical_protein [Hexamita inflata]|uniref:Hypothetical_protein n=2 Tax=Hexamita inflata TaxID=28002 RepID=A0ABP1LNS0_9EUKA
MLQNSPHLVQLGMSLAKPSFTQTMEEILDTIHQQKFVPLQVIVDSINSAQLQLDKILEITQEYITAQQGACDNSLLFLALLIISKLPEVTQDISQRYQQILTRLFSISNQVKELILTQLSLYCIERDKFALFSLHILKNLCVTTIIINNKQPRFEMQTTSLLDSELQLSLLKATKNFRQIVDPSVMYLQNIYSYLISDSSKLQVYCQSKFQELTLVCAPNIVARVLMMNNFIFEPSTDLNTQKMHAFLPNTVVHHLNILKKQQHVQKDKIKYQQHVKPQLDSTLFPKSIRALLTTENQHTTIKNALTVLYHAVNPFLDCTFENDDFEADPRSALQFYIDQMIKLATQNVNSNYDQVFIEMSNFVMASILYTNLTDQEQIVELVQTILREKPALKLEAFKIFDTLLLTKDINWFFNTFDDSSSEFREYIISRLLIIIETCANPKLTSKLDVKNETRSMIDEIDARIEDFKDLLIYCEEKELKNEKFSLFASLRKASYYLIQDLLEKALNLDKDSKLFLYLNKALSQLKVAGQDQSQYGNIVNKLILMLETIFNFQILIQPKQIKFEPLNKSQKLAQSKVQSNSLAISMTPNMVQSELNVSRLDTTARPKTPQKPTAIQYSYLITQKEKEEFLLQLQEQSDFKFETLKFINDHLISEKCPELLQLFIQLASSRPSKLAEKYVVPGLLFLLQNKNLNLSAHSALSRFNIHSLFSPQLVTQTSDLALSLLTAFEKGSQTQQLTILKFLETELDFLGLNQQPANQFVTKLFKFASVQRFGNATGFRQFCIQAEKSFAFTAEGRRPGTPVRVSSRPVTPVRIGSRPGTPVNMSRAGTPKQFEKSIGQKPLNQSGVRQQQMQFTNIYDIQYITQQLQLVAPNIKNYDLHQTFELVKLVIKQIDRFEQQLDMLYSLIVLQTQEIGQLSTPYAKLIEQLLKTFKISILITNPYLQQCTVFFLVKMHSKLNQKLSLQIATSLYKGLTVKFWMSVLSVQYTQEELQLLNPVLGKCLEFDEELKTEDFIYQAVKFLVKNQGEHLQLKAFIIRELKVMSCEGVKRFVLMKGGDDHNAQLAAQQFQMFFNEIEVDESLQLYDSQLKESLKNIQSQINENMQVSAFIEVAKVEDVNYIEQQLVEQNPVLMAEKAVLGVIQNKPTLESLECIQAQIQHLSNNATASALNTWLIQNISQYPDKITEILVQLKNVVALTLVDYSLLMSFYEQKQSQKLLDIIVQVKSYSLLKLQDLFFQQIVDKKVEQYVTILNIYLYVLQKKLVLIDESHREQLKDFLSYSEQLNGNTKRLRKVALEIVELILEERL